MPPRAPLYVMAFRGRARQSLWGSITPLVINFFIREGFFEFQNFFCSSGKLECWDSCPRLFSIEILLYYEKVTFNEGPVDGGSRNATSGFGTKEPKFESCSSPNFYNLLKNTLELVERFRLKVLIKDPNYSFYMQQRDLVLRREFYIFHKTFTGVIPDILCTRIIVLAHIKKIRLSYQLLLSTESFI